MRARTLIAAAAVLLGASCAGAPVRRVGVELPGDPSWPRDGGRRIAYVGEIRSPENLGIERGWLERAVRFLLGLEENQVLFRPSAVAVAPDGRLAVADPGRRAVHLFAPAQRRSLRIHAGLKYPVAAAFTGATLIVADAEAGALRAFDAEGRPASLPFEPPGDLKRPTGLAMDPARHRLYVSDAPAHRIHVVALAGGAAKAFGARGTGPGELNYPTHLALDAAGKLHVSDALNFRVQVFDPDDLRPLRSFGELGDTPGTFARPKGLAVDGDGNTYVVEGLYDVIQVFGPDGTLLGILGGNGTEAGRLWLASGLAIDPAADRLYVADTFNARVQVLALHAAPAGPGSPARGERGTAP